MNVEKTARRMRVGKDTQPSRIPSRGATLFLEHDLRANAFRVYREGKSVSTRRGVARGQALPDHAHLSCESGIWMSPLICFTGPADDGMMSKSKISVGSHSVAQALGTSTTPEIWPWHGAVPRIE
jgi:hypothetical protein